MNPIRIYDYQMQTRDRVFDAVRALSREQYERSFAIGLKTIGSTLAHVMNAEWSYIERLECRQVPPYEQWPIQDENPPAFDVIERTWREQADRVRSVIAAERDWQRRITWLSFPDDTRGNKHYHISCTGDDLFTQLGLHEVHHRAQIMAMLRELGVTLQDLDYNALMFERTDAVCTQ